MKKSIYPRINGWFVLLFVVLGGFSIRALGSELQIGLRTLSLANNFSAVHFGSAGNDFGGGTFRVSTQKKLEDPIVIQSPNGDKISCSTHIQGYYYNSQRGERLRPLDQPSLLSLQGIGDHYDDLTVTWWLYTNCEDDLYGIYGKVQHNLLGGDVFELVAGLNYSWSINQIIPNSSLSCNLQLINNKTVIGYLYDKNWGVGFVGGHGPRDDVNLNFLTALWGWDCVSDYCKMNSRDNVVCDVAGKERTAQNNRSFQDLKRSIAVRGVVGLTKDILSGDRENIIGNFGDKTQTVATDALSVADSINAAALQAEKLCRNAWKSDLNDLSGKTICYDGGSNFSIADPSDWKGKTLVVKNANVSLLKYMKAGDQPFSLFIDGGNLIIPNEIATGELLWFDDAGYPNISSFVNKGNYLKGTFIINGLLLSKHGTMDTVYTWVLNKLYLHGKLMSFNTYDDPSQIRENLVSSLLQKETTSSNYQDYISFRDLFLRRCQDDWFGTDTTDCALGVSEFARAALVLIDEDYRSPLLK